MFVAQTIASEHKDLIHDVSFNCHGRRMATSSSDHTVKVWDLVNSKWQCTASWTTPGGSVFRVTWAHPEFGQVLATCSFDRTVAVWEEISGDLSVKNGSLTNSWLKRISIADSRTTVTDVCFAPKHLGLKLATCSSDMIVRIYEAVDVMKLSNWQLQYEFNCNIPLSCLSWGTSRMHAPLIAVGSDNTNKTGGKVLIYEFSEANRKWQKVDIICSVNDPVHDVKFAPCVGRPFHQLAIASNELTIVCLKNVRDEGRQSSSEHSIFEIRQSGRFNDHGSEVRRLSWNITGTILSSSGDDGSVRLWKANYLDNWKCFSVLKADSSAPEEERASVHNPIMSSTPGLFRY